MRDPLRGGVYLVRPAGQPLPNLVEALRGQVSVDLVGRVAIPGGRQSAATFADVPDVPIKRFVLRFHPGPRGVVGLARDLCGLAAAPVARVLVRSHAGSWRELGPPAAHQWLRDGAALSGSGGRIRRPPPVSQLDVYLY